MYNVHIDVTAFNIEKRFWTSCLSTMNLIIMTEDLYFMSSHNLFLQFFRTEPRDQYLYLGKHLCGFHFNNWPATGFVISHYKFEGWCYVCNSCYFFN